MIKKVLFIIISILIFILAFFVAKTPEVNLERAFLDKNSNLVKLTNLSSNYLTVIFEAENKEDLDEIQTGFKKENLNYREITDIYKNYPENFLSDEIKNLIIEKNYKKLDEIALNQLYSPFSLILAPINSDPYLLSTNYLLSKNLDETIKEKNGKFYSKENFKIKDKKQIENFLKLQKENEKGKIYLAGAPIHSYLTSEKSSFEINLICIISTIALILLFKFYFKNIKILIPVILSILFGFLFGFSISTLIFKKLHILTFVFSTTLIGISLDYSLHSFLVGDEKNFIKNLTVSMLTTVFAFLILLFSNMEILKQIAVFTSFGLIGVYLFVVVFLYGKINLTPKKTFEIENKKVKVVLSIFVLLVLILGGIKIKFNDDIKNLYKPTKKLELAEKINSKVFNSKQPNFILVEGKNLDEILQKEEKLNIKNSISISNFIQSTKKQKENQKLVQNLYKNNLDSYATFLSKAEIQKLKNKEFKIYDVENFPLKKDFMLDNSTSFIMTSEKINGSINPTVEITKKMTELRKEILFLTPFLYLALFLFLTFSFGIKKGVKIIAPSLVGVLFSICFMGLFNIEINLFHILSLILITGFSLDYSIFRANSGDGSKCAVFVSFLSTAFSFLLLSTTSFKLISSIGLTLFLGVTVSYLLSLFMVKSNNEK